MLTLPTRGVAVSVNEHNVDLDVLCDWIEASILFCEDELSQSDVVDVLIEENIYRDQDMGYEIVGSAMTEMRKRHSWIRSGSPFSFHGNTITRNVEWRTVPVYSFCILLSAAALYKEWARSFGTDYTEQGELFELVTKDSLAQQFKDWKFFLTGWSRSKTDQLNDIVEQIADRLGEGVGNTKRWTSEEQKDGGLDLVLYRPFPDQRVGIPLYLMQCASGQNWEEKLNTPDINFWRHIVDFASEPKRGFATPFAMGDKEFIRKCCKVNGIFIDRYRLLATTKPEENWVPGILKSRLLAWAAPRVDTLLAL